MIIDHCFFRNKAAIFNILVHQNNFANPDTGIRRLIPDYDKYSFQQLLKTEPVVLLDVTAAWCITCKANEKIALAGDNFEALVKEQNVTLVRADWTREDPDITALLEQFGRKSVPLYVVFKQGATPEILPQILTPNIVRQAISNN